jgi:hypothetical protein
VVQSTGSADVVWSSAAPAVATVSPGGQVAGAGAGTTYVRAVSEADASKRDSALVRVYGPVRGGSAWRLVTPPPADTISRDAAVGRTSTPLRARISGPAGSFQSPFAFAEFWARAVGDTLWRFVGRAGPPTLVDAGDSRDITYSLDWNPTPADAPYTRPLTQVELIAVGVRADGAVDATPTTAQLWVAVP